MIESLSIFFRNPQTRSIGLLFGTLSILFSSWVTRLPEIQEKLSLSESELGYSLLAMSIGNVVITPLSAWLLTRTTLGKGNLASSLLYSFSFLFPVVAFNFNFLLVAMLVVGLTNGYMQFMINSAAASVEKQLKRRIMSTSHGMFSIGLMLGAGSSSLMAGWGVSPEIHLSSLCVLMIISSFLLRPVLLTFPENPLSVGRLTWPGKAIGGLLLLGFGFMFSEGVVMDWSALYLKNTLQSDAFLSGMGITGFSLFMTIGRFSGESLLKRWAPGTLIFWGGMTGSVGMVIAALSTSPMQAILGFSIVGAGYSVIAPMLFSAAAHTKGVHPNSGIAAIATAVILGIMVSRPLCGIVGEHLGLSASIGLGVITTISSTIGSRFVKIN